jgi:integrase
MKTDYELVYKSEERLESAMERLENSNITEKNKKLIKEFISYSSQTAKPITITKYIGNLISWMEWIKKDIDDVTIEYLLEVRLKSFKNYNPGGQNRRIDLIKQFFGWLEDSGYSLKVNYRDLKKLKRVKENKDVDPRTLLTPSDIQKMADASTNNRDRGIAKSLWEIYCRVGGFIKIRWKDIDFVKEGAWVRITDKTGARSIFVKECVPALLEWKNDQRSDGKNMNGFVWVTLDKNKTLIRPNTLTGILERLKEKAGIDPIKNVNPHNFRKSRASWLSTRIEYPLLCKQGGWILGSKELRRYIGIRLDEQKKTLLHDVYGEEVEENDENQLKTKKCLVCKKDYDPKDTYCPKCRIPLDREEFIHTNEAGEEMRKNRALFEIAIRDPVFRKMFNQYVNTGIIGKFSLSSPITGLGINSANNATNMSANDFSSSIKKIVADEIDRRLNHAKILCDGGDCKKCPDCHEKCLEQVQKKPVLIKEKEVRMNGKN